MTAATPDPATVAGLLAAARGRGVERLDAQLLLAHLLQRPRSWLLAHDDAVPVPAEAQAFEAALRRRADGVPLAYLTGEREFHGLGLRVTPDVLDPRPDTETLVDWALELLGPGGALAGLAAPEVVDLGTGSGAIALALKHRCPRARLSAVDASPAALAVARANGARLGIDVDWRLGDWLDGAAAAFDCIVSNPPYVATDDPHWPGLRHEPREALAAGPAGLDALERIVDSAPRHLRPGGWLLLEHGAGQAVAVNGRLAARGFVDIGHRQDLSGHTRCTGARWRGPGAQHATLPGP